MMLRCFFFFFFAVAVAFAQMPQPMSISRDDTVRVRIGPSFEVVSAADDAPTFGPMLSSLEEAFAFLRARQAPSEPYVTLRSVEVSFEEADTGQPFRALSANAESYELRVPNTENGTATIHAATVFGAYRGLQTFVQLAVAGLNPVNVTDAPRFRYRGLMLDTGRHFLPPETMMSVLRLASWAKINVFHWHATDAQSTPVQSSRFPQVAEKGAFRADLVYTLDNVASIREFCRRMGMELVLEFDMPGHSYAWGFGVPEMLPSNLTDPYCDSEECPARGIGCYAGVSPASQTTYDVLEAVVGECAANSEFLHLGTDEIEVACWENDPAIRAMAEGTQWFVDGPLFHFINKQAGIAQAAGIPNQLIWDDSFQIFPGSGATTKSLPTALVVQVWGGEGRMSDPTPIGLEALQRGHRVVMSPATRFYLGGGGNPGWAKYWEYEPTQFVAGQPAESNTTLLEGLLGGEACLWETAAEDLWWSIYWNLFLVGERLWSPADVVDQSDASTRLDSFASFVWDFYNATIQPTAFNASFVQWGNESSTSNFGSTPTKSGGGDSDDDDDDETSSSTRLAELLLVTFVAWAVSM